MLKSQFVNQQIQVLFIDISLWKLNFPEDISIFKMNFWN